MSMDVRARRGACRRRHSARVYRRRRAAALGVLCGLVLAIRPAGAGLVGLAGAGAAPAQAHVTRHIVEPGESFWSIAKMLEPDRDPRVVVHELREAMGRDGLVPGQVVEWAG